MDLYNNVLHVEVYLSSLSLRSLQRLQLVLHYAKSLSQVLIIRLLVALELVPDLSA